MKSKRERKELEYKEVGKTPSKQRKLRNVHKLHKVYKLLKTSAPTLGRSLKAQPAFPRHPLFNFNGFTRQVEKCTRRSRPLKILGVNSA